MSKVKEVLLNPIFNDNPIALQILGICSALAVTGNLYITLIMCVALTTVVTLSNLFVSLIRNHIPTNIRIIVQISIIAKWTAIRFIVICFDIIPLSISSITECDYLPIYILLRHLITPWMIS